MEKNEKTRYYCKICNSKCQKRETLIKHLKQKHKKEIIEGKVEEIEAIKCQKCE